MNESGEAPILTSKATITVPSLYSISWSVKVTLAGGWIVNGLGKLVDGVEIELTAQEISQRKTEEDAWKAGAFDRAIAGLRSKRNALLSATDYLALSDNTLSAAMSSYRQSLRDLTEGLSTVEQVNSVVFPVKP